MKKEKSILKKAANTKVPFTIVHNQIIFDKRLSWQAKGLMAYFLSRPDNWQFYESEIQTHSKNGRRSTQTAIQELIKIGYIERRQKRTQGMFSHYEYTIHAISNQPPQPIRTEITKRDSGKRTNSKKDNSKTQKSLLDISADLSNATDHRRAQASTIKLH